MSVVPAISVGTLDVAVGVLSTAVDVEEDYGKRRKSWCCWAWHGKETGRIVRKRVKDTKIKFDGFNWRKAAVYIQINKKILSRIGTKQVVFRYLPIRKSNKGVQPRVGSKGMKRGI